MNNWPKVVTWIEAEWPGIEPVTEMSWIPATGLVIYGRSLLHSIIVDKAMLPTASPILEIFVLRNSDHSQNSVQLFLDLSLACFQYFMIIHVQLT